MPEVETRVQLKAEFGRVKMGSEKAAGPSKGSLVDERVFFE